MSSGLHLWFNYSLLFSLTFPRGCPLPLALMICRQTTRVPSRHSKVGSSVSTVTHTSISKCLRRRALSYSRFSHVYQEARHPTEPRLIPKF
ncbi:hypothetical protein LZ30DRAFT_701836 [Colletotrichum cereale]|nr:hypothetical protein LZ30DRAFT_701836 [Colletotrichum cereale]